MDSKKFDCGIIGVWTANNYGSCLTAYALQEAIKSIGYNAKTINFIKLPENHYGNLSDNFGKKYLDLTNECFSFIDLINLNNQTSTFIVGSDCMWYPWFFNYVSKEYPHFLSFANLDAKKIAYSTSFGTYDREYPDNEKYRMKYYLDQFDKISVREKAGIPFCEERFNLKVEQNIDPVFLLESEYYNKIINDSNVKLPEQDYIAVYNFKNNEKIEHLNNLVKEKYNLPIVDIYKTNNVSVSDWLKYIKNCKILITHSFHGLCFALIFNKPFIVWKIDSWDDNRYASVLKTLGLEDRLINDLSEIDSRADIFEPIDWDRVNLIIEKEKERGLKWLKEALEAPKDLSKVNPADAIIQNLQSKICLLQYSSYQTISAKSVFEILNYKKIYAKYLKYKILKNFVFGKTRTRYKEKQKIYHEKVRRVRELKKRYN